MEEGLKIEVRNDRYKKEGESDDEGELDLIEDDDDSGSGSGSGNKGSRLSRSTGIKVTVFNDKAENMDKEDGEVSDENIEAMEVDSNSDELDEYQKALGIRISFNPAEKDEEKDDDQIDEEGQINDLTPSPPPYSPRPRQYHQRYNNKRKGFRSNPDPESIPTRIYPNPYLEIFNPEKLNSRALRFGASTEKSSSQPFDNEFQLQLMKKPTDEDILDIYLKNGLLVEDGEVNSLDKVASNFRSDALLVRGTNDMSTDDIFMYFAKNRQNPVSLEWVNDACCVVVFKSPYDAASCVINMTKPIVHVEKKKKGENDEEDADCADEDSKKEEEAMAEDFDFYNVDQVSSKMVAVPMPPGSVWRFCPPCDKAKGIIIRFATTSDKKQDRAEKYSEFYKKHGNPNNQIRGSDRVNNKRHYTKVDNDEKQDARVEPKKLPSKPVSNKLAWTELSALWNEEEQGIKRKPLGLEDKEMPNNRRKEKFQRQEKPSFIDDERGYGLGGGLTISVNLEGNELREYFNRKRKHDDSSEQLLFSNPSDDDDDSSQLTQDSIWSKKLRRPRMKMHADEEQDKIRKRNSRPSAAAAAAAFVGHDMARSSRGPESYDNRDIDFSMGHQQDFHRGTRYSQNHNSRNTGNREGRTRVRRQLVRNRIESTTKNFNSEWDLRQIIQNRKKNNISSTAVPRYDLDDQDDEELEDIFDLVDGR